MKDAQLYYDRAKELVEISKSVIFYPESFFPHVIRALIQVLKEHEHLMWQLKGEQGEQRFYSSTGRFLDTGGLLDYLSLWREELEHDKPIPNQFDLELFHWMCETLFVQFEQQIPSENNTNDEYDYILGDINPNRFSSTTVLDIENICAAHIFEVLRRIDDILLEHPDWNKYDHPTEDDKERTLGELTARKRFFEKNPNAFSDVQSALAGLRAARKCIESKAFGATANYFNHFVDYESFIAKALILPTRIASDWCRTLIFPNEAFTYQLKLLNKEFSSYINYRIDNALCRESKDIWLDVLAIVDKHDRSGYLEFNPYNPEVLSQLIDLANTAAKLDWKTKQTNESNINMCKTIPLLEELDKLVKDHNTNKREKPCLLTDKRFREILNELSIHAWGDEDYMIPIPKAHKAMAFWMSARQGLVEYAKKLEPDSKIDNIITSLNRESVFMFFNDKEQQNGRYPLNGMIAKEMHWVQSVEKEIWQVDIHTNDQTRQWMLDKPKKCPSSTTSTGPKRHYRTRGKITYARASELTGFSKRQIQNLTKDPKNTLFPGLNVTENTLLAWALVYKSEKVKKHWANCINHPIPLSSLPDDLVHKLGF